MQNIEKSGVFLKNYYGQWIMASNLLFLYRKTFSI